MKDNTIYYLIKKTPNSFINDLPINILTYVKNKRGNNIKDSLFAWNLIKNYTGADLTNITFLESGKPILGGLSFSISHSNGYVAIAFIKSDVPLGIDIEKITNRDLKFLTKLSKKFVMEDKTTPFKLWTEHESTVKALNLNVLKDFNCDFVGLSKTINTLDGEFSLSIYNCNNLEIKELTYED